MLKILERNIAAVERRLVLLAPPQARIPDTFAHTVIDASRHARLLHEVQAVRGAIYMQGGYVRELSADGVHMTPEDEKSWHLLMTDDQGHVTSCIWYLEHQNSASVDDLRVRHCPLARSGQWREILYEAVNSELTRARDAGLRYAEVGGWAVSQARRCTSEGLVLALAAYGLCRVLGGALGITTANVTHASSSILRRLGGAYLEWNGSPFPAYFDPRYNTTIELLRFDSRRPSVKYSALIELVRQRLAHVSVIASRGVAPAAVVPAGFDCAAPAYAVA